jgi:hypothetical protein
MAYIQPQPPTVNGMADFANKESASFDQVKVDGIRTKLQAIETNFVPTEDNPVFNLFYQVSEYNKANTEPINGDTAQAILAEQVV